MPLYREKSHRIGPRGAAIARPQQLKEPVHVPGPGHIKGDVYAETVPIAEVTSCEMGTTETSKNPRISLQKGQVVSGQVAVGPNHFWRVPLDEGTLEWSGELLVLTGKETRLVAYGESVVSCVQQFWDGFCDLRRALQTGSWNPEWLSTDDERWLFKLVLEDRFLKATASPPAAKDGRAYELLGEFWDGQCPPEKNVRPVRMISLDW